MDEIKTAPKVSVVVPAYNCEGFLPETLDCLLTQSLKDIQIIIVDDGSTDGTPAMVDRFAAQDKRVTAIHKENGGVSSARNQGIELAEGKYILFLDSDDLLSQTALEEMYNALENTGSDLALCRCMRFGFGGTEYNPIVDSLARETAVDCFDKRLLWNFLPANKCCRTELLKNSGVRFPSTRYSEDGAFWLPLILTAKPKITGVYSAVMKYRRHQPDEGKSVTQSISVDLLQNFRTSLEIVYTAAEAVGADDDYLQEIIYKTYYTLQNEFYRLLWGADDEALAFISAECGELRKRMTPATLKRLDGANRELGSPLASRRAAAERPTVSITVGKGATKAFLRSLYAQSMPLFEVISRESDPEFAEFENFNVGGKARGKIKLRFSGKKPLDPRLLRVIVLLKTSPKFGFLPDFVIKWGAMLFLKLKK